jgi:stage V sporulation protein S
MELLRVGANSKPNSVAGALAGIIRKDRKVELQAIGAGAVNQSVKAFAIARGFVSPQGFDLVCIPAFSDAEIDGDERTVIKFTVEAK